MSKSLSSRISGFYKLTMSERRDHIIAEAGLAENAFSTPFLDESTANHMAENVVGVYGLPFGIGLNFQINGRDHLVPMCVEEPSVVAAASNAARMIRLGGGFTAESDAPIMIAQVQLCDVLDVDAATRAILAVKAELLREMDATCASLCKRGGGARDIEVRVLERANGTRLGMLAVHLLIDVQNAMGANIVNSIAEAMADRLAALAQAKVGLRILSNLADRRCVRVTCRVPASALATDGDNGEDVRDGIVSASRFAELDPYRAATHNKGIMNGCDAVVIATGNDWRGTESGAHAFAATKGAAGNYGPLCVWRVGEDGALHGSIEMPMAIGTVGGTLRVHPGARLALEIAGTTEANDLAHLIVATGMASNLAALRALASEGIQRGHMSLHARSVALSAGAEGELVERVATEIARLGDIRAERAKAVLEEFKMRASLGAAGGIA
jgi:hydroxymethylglutaryl-CoA reductase